MEELIRLSVEKLILVHCKFAISGISKTLCRRLILNVTSLSSRGFNARSIVHHTKDENFMD